MRTAPTAELAPDEVVERDALGHEVAPGLGPRARRAPSSARTASTASRSMSVTSRGPRPVPEYVPVPVRVAVAVRGRRPAIASMRSRASIGAPAAGAT